MPHGIYSLSEDNQIHRGSCREKRNNRLAAPGLYPRNCENQPDKRSTESPSPYPQVINNDILDDRSHQNYQDHAISVAPGTSQKCERTWRGVIRDSLITLSWDSVSPSARTLRA